MKRLVLGTLLAASVLLAGAAQAGAAALVPLAPSSGAWGSSPIYATSPPGDPRVFIVERSGGIRIVNNGALQPGAFLTVPNILTTGERGLLSLAFAPDYATSGLFYVFAVTGPAAQLQVIEYKVSSDPDVANPASARPVLSITDNDQYHNGGQVVFGPDGYLYITVGDDKTSANSQTLSNLLGKVLRIDPRVPAGGGDYSIPPTNPFVGSGGNAEIWQLGLRNPFRASFGPDGQLIVPDVGETTAEEINFAGPGANFGWPSCEGNSCSNPAYVNPFYTYTHSGSPGGCAIIGGYYVSDPTLSGLTGRYLFGDFCDKTLRTVSLSTPGGDFKATNLTLDTASLYSFGTDSKGCVYVMADSTAYRVAANAGDSAACTLTTAGPVAATKPSIKSRRLKANSRGKVRVKILCGGPVACTGSVTIRSAKRLTISGKRRTVTFGKAAYKRLRAGASKYVTVKLRKQSLKLLNRRGKVRVKLTVTAKVAGTSKPATSSRTVTLRSHS
jgi:hypothetical protein